MKDTYLTASLPWQRSQPAAAIRYMVSDIPQFTGKVACVGQESVFDAALHDSAAREQAVRICTSSCECLDQCAAWVATLAPDEVPVGVTAGRFLPVRDRRQTARKPAPDRPRTNERRVAG